MKRRQGFPRASVATVIERHDQMLQFLQVDDIFRLACVSKACNNALNDDTWTRFGRQNRPDVTASTREEWKDFYNEQLP